MATRWLRAGAALSLLLAAACAQPTPAQRAAAVEQTALAPLKAKYPDIITAFDPAGTRLDVAIDANAYIQTDDDVVDRFKSDAAKAWRTAWIAAHPHQHTLLTVRLIDAIARPWVVEHIRA